MRILLIHTYYRVRGGEDTVFEQEVKLLSKNNEVDVLIFENKNGIKGLFQFVLSIWNIFSAKKMEQKIIKFNPDVIHIHNLHFASGPLLIRKAKKYKIPVILTLHNYRLLCPSGVLLYNNKIFKDSLQVDFPWEAIKNKVYRESILQTFWLAFIIWFHKRINTWRKVDKYITLTNFSKKLYINSSFGVCERNFIVKPNFIEKSDIRFDKKDDYFLFVGRLSEEKGINILLEAFKSTNYNLKIVGAGPLLIKVKEVCRKYSNITYLGSLNKQKILENMYKSTALIFPSIWYEGMPMTLIESLLMKTISVSSNIGAMSTMLENNSNGLLFEAGNVESLKQKINEWVQMVDIEKTKMREKAYNTYLKYYTPEINEQILNEIYKNVLCREKD